MFHAYPASVSQLIQSAALNQLGPGNENTDVLGELSTLTIDSLGDQIVDEEMAQCCISGLWLRHNFLDRSHTISQDISTPEGSYWHGIMHRREPDYSNSKYWYRNVGAHEIFRPLGEQIAGNDELNSIVARFDLIVDDRFEPFNFVDACQAVAGKNDQQSSQGLREIAELEWQWLFAHCYQGAVKS